MHELIPVRISQQYQGWRRDIGGTEKDAVYEPLPFYSFEIKTSSHPSRVFGNRSYAQQGASSKRIKDGYLLAINFQGFKLTETPTLTRVRFGWIDHDDWVGQAAPTGQQASLSRDADRFKLLDIM